MAKNNKNKKLTDVRRVDYSKINRANSNYKSSNPSQSKVYSKNFSAPKNSRNSKSNKRKNLNPFKAFKNFIASLKTKQGRKRALKIFFGIVLVGFFFVVALFAWYAKDLPTPGTLRERQQVESTKIYDRNDQLLFEIHGDQRRTVLASEDIPELVKQATIAVEDRRFYEHRGVDFRGLARAAYLDIFRGERVGGSTLTQQFIKNAVLTNEKTFDRKLKELILAIELEAMFSKDEILTMYLNEIPYGSVNYGIQSAAQSFYGKQVQDLELHEIATLAAIPQRPTFFSPYGTNTERLKERRDYILNTMVELENITEEEAEEAKENDILAGIVPQSSSIQAPHFVFYVKEQLVEEYGEEVVEQGGLSIKTTLDLELQNIAQQAVKTGVDQQASRNVSNGAMVATDPKTGEILAMVGSKDYFDSSIDGNVNVTLTRQQPGSSFKPIVVAAALEEGFSPATNLWDVKTDFNGYSPNNYDLRQRGPISLRNALGNSLNIPLVKLLDLIGLNKALEKAQDFGITTLNDPSRYGLSLVLGGGDVLPLDMATAFGTFAAEGTYRPPVSILEVKDHDGNILFEHHEGRGEKEVLRRESAYQISHILSDNSARSAVFGPNSLLNFGNRPVAVKTGTTQEFRDAWTVGYTPSLSVAVWVGNNDNSQMRNADGSVVAAPIFRSFLTQALQGQPIEQFTRPSTISTITVDRLSAKLATEDSPETVSEIFAPWQRPTEEDDVHVRVSINKLNGKLATEFTPESLVEEKLFTVINSERPNVPAWQNPVLAWARAAGYNMDQPPTERDDMYDEAKMPRVSFGNLNNNATVSQVTTIEANASAHYNIKSVEFYVDNVRVNTRQSAPYNFEFNPSIYGSGAHILTLRIIDENDASSTNSIDITIVGDTTPPSSGVTGLSASSKSQAVELKWDNPSDEDLEKVLIYYSTSPSDLGTKHSTEIMVRPSTTTTYTVEGLNPLTTYYFTLRPADTWGNVREEEPYGVSAITLP